MFNYRPQLACELRGVVYRYATISRICTAWLSWHPRINTCIFTLPVLCSLPAKNVGFPFEAFPVGGRRVILVSPPTRNQLSRVTMETSGRIRGCNVTLRYFPSFTTTSALHAHQPPLKKVESVTGGHLLVGLDFLDINP